MKRKTALIFSLMLITFLGVAFLVPALGQEKTKTQVATEETKPFTILRLVIAQDVQNKEPVGVAEAFPASTEKVYCFLEAGTIIRDMDVSFVWFHGQNEMRKIALPLPMGSRWRTYAYKNLVGIKGDWKVEIRDQAGKVIGETKFKVE